MKKSSENSEFHVPEIFVTKRTAEPIVIEALGTVGLSHIVAVHPKFDTKGDGYFAHAQVANKTLVRKISQYDPEDGVEGDKGSMLYEISVRGDDHDSLSCLNTTIENMRTLANPWKNPEKFLELLYKNAPTT